MFSTLTLNLSVNFSVGIISGSVFGSQLTEITDSRLTTLIFLRVFVIGESYVSREV